jgi:uncharacterized membrane protein YcaP (DUF421 family)
VVVDWRALFVPSVPLLETFVRGSVVYLALFVLLRLFKREAGAFNVTDMLVLVLIADAAQNAMAANYTSVTDGLLLVATIIGWSFALDALAYWSPALARVLHPPARDLVRDGRMLRRNMRREFVSEEELMSQIRQQGVADVSEVKRACIEGDGRISVIARAGAEPGPRKPRARGT